MSASAPPNSRGERLTRLTDREVDVLVIGAGATGAATAMAAARAGARVAIIDRGDAAGATSSASSKLLHGGLRYLKSAQVRLVHEAHRERRLAATVVAPHLARPLQFVVPIAPTTQYRATELRAGVLLYGALSGFRDGRSGRISAAAAQQLVPGLRTSDRRFVSYHDHETDDARLVLAGLQTAEQFGALWLNYVAVEELLIEGGRVVGAEARDRLTGEPLRIHARVVVNAAGPWVDHVRRLEDPAAAPSIRLSKGAHLLLDVEAPWGAAVTSPMAEGRVAFGIPWHDMLLLGTTDEPFEEEPEFVSVTDADRAQILDEAAVALLPETIAPHRVRAAFAGLRVLPLGRGGTASAARETVFSVGPKGLVSIAGGKLTTWRAIGIKAATHALKQIGGPTPSTDAFPLVGATQPRQAELALAAAYPQLPETTIASLVGTYGSLSHNVLAAADHDPSLLDPIVDGAPELMAQVRYAIEHEQACTFEDIVRRRTAIAVRGLDGAARERIAPFLSPNIHLSEVERAP